MKLCNKNEIFKNEYICELTDKLDSLSGLDKLKHYDIFYHYILADDYCKNIMCLAIRVPGGTVGGIEFDENNIITNIVIDTDYVVKTYPDNIKEIIKDYIGKTIEYLE